MKDQNNLTKIRVAAVQLGVTSDVAANLATCCRLIDQAATHQPDVIVLPEFCNHLAWYNDREHSYDVAVALDGEFLQTIGEKAVEHQCTIMINCTVRRPNQRVTGSNILFDSNGKIIGTSDKQVLMGNENNFLDKAAQNGEILPMNWGQVGMYSCMDGVIFETSRGLAVRGPQILLNSLNSFARDEGDLHIPVRAAENKIFVAAANKIGPLVPPEMLDAIAARLQIDPDQLYGAGHSQIVGPDGTVLAKAPAQGEAVVFADIDISEANNKLRPDGTDVMGSRRPDLYQVFQKEPSERQKAPAVAESQAAVFQPSSRGPHAVGELIHWLAQAAQADAGLVSLPELFHLENGQVGDVDLAADVSDKTVAEIKQALAGLSTDLIVATTVVERDGDDYLHVGLLINRAGVLLRQSQLHACGRHPWISRLGSGVNTFDAEWGRTGIVVGNDAIYPESFRLLVIEDAEVVAVSTEILEAWESELGLLERAAENRMNLVVGSPRDAVGPSMILAADPDFTLWTTWHRRPFDGNINTPIVTRTSSEAGGTIATIYPAASANRTISQNTNVVENRPWWLADALLN